MQFGILGETEALFLITHSLDFCIFRLEYSPWTYSLRTNRPFQLFIFFKLHLHASFGNQPARTFSLLFPQQLALCYYAIHCPSSSLPNALRFLCLFQQSRQVEASGIQSSHRLWKQEARLQRNLLLTPPALQPQPQVQHVPHGRTQPGKLLAARREVRHKGAEENTPGEVPAWQYRKGDARCTAKQWRREWLKVSWKGALAEHRGNTDPNTNNSLLNANI